MNLLKTSFAFLQKIGKALMLPVAVLPIAGLLLGIGSAHFAILPDMVSNIMAQSGTVIFGNLPLIFAIGTALGLANNDGVSALSAVVGYVVMLATMGVFAKVLGAETTQAMGIDTIDSGVFGGIAIGLIAALLFNRYYRLELPPYLGFFSGKRAVPIITAGAAVAFGLVLSVCWPPIGSGIHQFSQWAAKGNPAVAFTLYGLVERLLIPFGLHHIWNVPFFFESGQYLDPKTGKMLTGEVARYIAGDPSAGNLAGGYLFKMFGLPAAAIAIWKCAKPENRTKVSGIMISAALTSFLTGITEPIEFTFMFVAPALYAVHALLCGFAYFICITLGIKHGMTFSHGLIDFLILFPQSTRAFGYLILGPFWAAMYYAIFTFAIRKFDLKTPGRELEADVLESTLAPGASKAEALIAAFGGAANIRNLDSCITRLRIQVDDPDLVQSDQLKAMGATAVLKVADGVQAIFGTASENLKTDMENYMRNRPSAPKLSVTAPKKRSPLSTSKVKITLNVDGLKTVLGGKENLLSVAPVAMTRLRVELKDLRRLRGAEVEAQGVQAVQEIAPGLYHLIVGEQAEAVAQRLS